MNGSETMALHSSVIGVESPQVPFVAGSVMRIDVFVALMATLTL